MHRDKPPDYSITSSARPLLSGNFNLASSQSESLGRSMVRQGEVYPRSSTSTIGIEREEKPSRRTLVDSDNFASIATSPRRLGYSVTVKDGHNKMVARPKGKYADFCVIGVETVEQK
jgi:hypothetical protein